MMRAIEGLETVIPAKIMWPDITTDNQVRSGLSIANGVNHPVWDGLAIPSKDETAYMKALQGGGGPFFGRVLERSIENHKKIFAYNDSMGKPYADLLEWWRRFLLTKNIAMILPFPLEQAGDPFIRPPDTRFVQQVGSLYIYGSSLNPGAMVNRYIRGKR
jgi:hypothetical protein